MARLNKMLNEEETDMGQIIQYPEDLKGNSQKCLP